MHQAGRDSRQRAFSFSPSTSAATLTTAKALGGIHLFAEYKPATIRSGIVEPWIGLRGKVVLNEVAAWSSAQVHYVDIGMSSATLLMSLPWCT